MCIMENLIYKGKGVRYSDERVTLKETKKK